MTSQDFTIQLLWDPTERGIRCLDPNAHYVVLPTNLGNLSMAGYIVLEVDDGLLMIPYHTVEPDLGWEQLDLASSRLVPRPQSWETLITAYQKTLDSIDDLLSAYL